MHHISAEVTRPPVPGLVPYGVFADLKDAYQYITDMQPKMPETQLEVRNPRGSTAHYTWTVVCALEEQQLMDYWADYLATHRWEPIRHPAKCPRQPPRTPTSSGGGRTPHTVIETRPAEVIELPTRGHDEEEDLDAAA